MVNLHPQNENSKHLNMGVFLSEEWGGLQVQLDVNLLLIVVVLIGVVRI